MYAPENKLSRDGFTKKRIAGRRIDIKEYNSEAESRH